MTLRLARRGSPLLACGLLFMLRAASAFDVVRARPGMEADHRFAFASRFALTAFVTITTNIACFTLGSLLLDSGSISIDTSPSPSDTGGIIDASLLGDSFDSYSGSIDHILSSESSVTRVADGDAAAAANGPFRSRTPKARRSRRSATAASAVRGSRGSASIVSAALPVYAVNDFEEILVAQRVLMVTGMPVDQQQRNRTIDNATTGDSSAVDFSWLWGSTDGDSFASRASSAWSAALEAWRLASAWVRSWLHDTHSSLCSSSEGAGDICDVAGDTSTTAPPSLPGDLCVITAGPGCPHFDFPNITCPLPTGCVPGVQPRTHSSVPVASFRHHFLSKPHEPDVRSTPCDTPTISSYLLFCASILTVLGFVIICGYLGLVGAFPSARMRRRRPRRRVRACGHARPQSRLAATFNLQGCQGIPPSADITSLPPSDADDIAFTGEIENARRTISAANAMIPTLPESLNLLHTRCRLNAAETNGTLSPAQPSPTVLAWTLRDKLSQTVDRRVMDARGATIGTGSEQVSGSPLNIAPSHAARMVQGMESMALDVLELAVTFTVTVLPPVEQYVAPHARADGARAAMNIAVVDSAAAAEASTDVACPDACPKTPDTAIPTADVGERATCDRTCGETDELGKEDPPPSPPALGLAASITDCAGAPTAVCNGDEGGMVDQERVVPITARSAACPPCAALASTAAVGMPKTSKSDSQRSTERLVGPSRHVSSSFSFAAAVKGLPSPVDVAGAGEVVSEDEPPTVAVADEAREKTAVNVDKSSDPEPEPPAGSRRLSRWRGRGTRGGKKRNKKKGKAGGEAK